MENKNVIQEAKPVVSLPEEIRQENPISIQELSAESARAVAQIQGAMAIAKRFPRDENAAIVRMMNAASRRSVAEKAEYEYKKGGANVSGPSIRALEVIAQAWGNMLSGIKEVSRDGDSEESLMLAYAADLETNNWKFIEWRVPHYQDRSAANGGAKKLDSSRDIYERVMNDGSRRLRNCLMAVIPSDVVEDFISKCDKTLNDNSIPLVNRIDEMLKAMAQLGVTQAMVENELGCLAKAITERQLSQLRRIYQSIKDGFGAPTDYFKTAMSKDATEEFKRNLKKKEDSKKEPEKKEEAKTEEGAFNEFAKGK